MKTYTTTTGQAFTVIYVAAQTAGYGHKTITASLADENGNLKEFKATTSNMPGYDEAVDFEGQDKYEALFELVEYALDEQISEWLQGEEN